MLIYHKIAAQDSKRSHGGGSQIGDMEGSGLIEMLDEEIYNFKSERNTWFEGWGISKVITFNFPQGSIFIFFSF